VSNSGPQPNNEDCLKGYENNPVVWVDWDYAIAFCGWLTRRWRETGWLPQNWRVTLPNEPEWEKAARGGFRIPPEPGIGTISALTSELSGATHRQDMVENPWTQRRYPWGDPINDEFLNFDMNIAQVSTPGVYTNGKSVYGCQDLSGNVWEWTRSRYEGYPYPQSRTEAWRQREAERGDASRVLRGGSFYDFQRYVRSAVRGSYHPTSRDDGLGFRVCLSPFPLTADSLTDDTLNR
jgi:formylglycine-generating enzyme required for sulfatase activity